MGLRKADGFFWPDSDVQAKPALLHDVKFVESHWLPYCDRRNIVVQAGGNCGLYPRELSKHFGAVYTAEPDLENFLCLCMNAPANNIYPFRCAFGDKPRLMGLHKAVRNTGAHWMEGDGTIPVIRIDDLALPACDLIALDIEGAELPALRGAEDTIGAFDPVLIIEDKGHGSRFGYSTQDLHDWLKRMGYESRGFVLRDQVWTVS